MLEVDPMPLEVDATPPKVRARVGSGAMRRCSRLASVTVEHGGWRHVVLTYDVATKQLRLYVNSDDGTPDKELGGVSLPPNSTSPTTARPCASQPGNSRDRRHRLDCSSRDASMKSRSTTSRSTALRSNITLSPLPARPCDVAAQCRLANPATDRSAHLSRRRRATLTP